MSFYLYFFLFFISYSEIHCLNVHQIIASILRECKIKFLNQSWLDIDDCDRTNFEEYSPDESRETNDLYIDYKVGDKLDIYLKFYSHLPKQEYIDSYCCVYLWIKINEYLIDNHFDYIYYCSNCGCSESHGDKTYCHKFGDDREYCQLL